MRWSSRSQKANIVVSRVNANGSPVSQSAASVKKRKKTRLSRVAVAIAMSGWHQVPVRRAKKLRQKKPRVLRLVVNAPAARKVISNRVHAVSRMAISVVKRAVMTVLAAQKGVLINRAPIPEIVLRGARIAVQDLALLVRKVISSRVHAVLEMVIRVVKKVVMIVRAVLKAVRKADQRAVTSLVHHVRKAVMIASKSVVRASASALS